jgi:hypothetical protein
MIIVGIAVVGILCMRHETRITTARMLVLMKSIYKHFQCSPQLLSSEGQIYHFFHTWKNIFEQKLEGNFCFCYKCSTIEV